MKHPGGKHRHTGRQKSQRLQRCRDNRYPVLSFENETSE